MSSSIPGILPRSSAPATEAVSGVVVHYHEIGLKGRNRGYFERRLAANLGSALHGCRHDGIEVLNGRFLIRTPGAPDTIVLERVGKTFGVAKFAPCSIGPVDLDSMAAQALSLLGGRNFETFAVAARRATKELAITSREINIALGSAVEAATGAGVDLGKPDVTVYVEVVGNRSFVYVDRMEGPGGLPVGVSGKVVSLLSGGIDSPVATYRICKRGATAILCHFHSAPFTDRSSARKATELARIISSWQGDTTMYVVAIGDAQQEIVRATPPDLRVVLYRRLMVRIAAEVARAEGAKALICGDSLGQVASQTLENMLCVDDASPISLMRPLIGRDKQEIITEAKMIGTYETSILPFEDCCSLFVPRSPATKASVAACRDAEKGVDIAALVASSFAGAEIERLRREPCPGTA